MGSQLIFNRAERLLGAESMQRLSKARVILFGVGGVGSWCAEGLVRSGLGHLTIVDSDRVSPTNINRQAMASTLTIGQVKVNAMRDRLLQIAPEADVQAVQEIYSPQTAELFHLEEYDYVVDAIDSLSCKMELLLHATRRDLLRADGHYPTLFSSMGAALKMDPMQVRVSEFWKVNGCPLAAMLRRRMRRQHRFPERKFRCVWSPEVLPNRGQALSAEIEASLTHPGMPTDERIDLANHDWNSSKAQVNGSMVHITAIMGFTLSGLILQDIVGG